MSTSPPPRAVPKKPPSQNPNVLRASVVPPLPPRSPDIRPQDTAAAVTVNTTTTAAATPTTIVHTTPPLPPRSPDLHSSAPVVQQHHHHHSPATGAPSSPTPPLPPRTLPPRGSTTTTSSSSSSGSSLSFDDISKTVQHNNQQQNQHQSATISHSVSSSNIQHPPLPQSKHSTYRKPLPPPPHEDNRLSLKTPPTSAPHPPIPPRSGSALTLSTTASTVAHRDRELPSTPPSHHNHSTSPQPHPHPIPITPVATTTTTNTSTMGGKDKERQSVIHKEKDSNKIRDSMIKNDKPSTSLENGGEIHIIREDPDAQAVTSNHPSLDHLAAFTSLRDMKAKEILTTERTYCDNMKILVEVFIEPLKYGEGGISKESATIICSNLSDILLVSVELLNQLEERLATWSTTQRIGDVFKTLIPFLKMYTNYTVGFDNALTTVSDCEKNSTFVSFIQKCTEDPRTKKLDLRSYLIQPVQRITRYHMLLDELLKHTDASHPDYGNLADALDKMKRVTSEANEAIKRSENRAKVMEIQKMFVGDIDIVAAHRSFVFEGVLTKVCRKACKKRNVFLFSDLLLYGSSMPPKLLLHEKINLEFCRIEDIPDGDSGGSRAILLNGSGIVNAFQICSNKKSFVVFADTAESKMLWMLRLTETIESLQQKRSTLKSDSKETSSEAPVWVPDETTTNCPFCEEGFTLLNRRHHCRNCGELVCGKCSEKKFKLPISNFKAVRVKITTHTINCVLKLSAECVWRCVRDELK
ncbi:pleckstrin domain-containing protein [Cavenderia fasciculata]|uniref:Pleckstrin domain-containing protein n=1 Tax=Cavenderia fasciculata TaxID=261658 RepID=F4PTE4_CACFS|nr:pleckstrin domain-containing protein [Cavenderia fasciculata]EGG21666.1 pleckstrin domain-containing protein [Cavenderia fasciculata]|eukprot:XP_004359516.1 pleckstrin domain-containing protein [Cavenderia fasciculata]